MGFLIPRASAAEGDVPVGWSRKDSGFAEMGARGRETRRSSSSCSCYPRSRSSQSLLFQQQTTCAVTLPGGFALASEELSPRSSCGVPGSLAPFPLCQGKPCLLLARAPSQPCCLQPGVRVPGGKKAALNLPCSPRIARSGCAESEVSCINLFSSA